MKLQLHWSFEDRFSTLRQIASESRQKDPQASVLAIAEANRMLEALARNPSLLQNEEPVVPEKPTASVYSPATLAKRWGCSERHICRLIEDREIPSFRVGTLIRVKASDAKEYEYRMEHAQSPKQLEPVTNGAVNHPPLEKRARAKRLDTPEMRAMWKAERNRGR